MDYASRAEQLHAGGLNCAQAVAGAFSELLADRVSSEDLLRLMSPFGGGFARTRNLCGAVSAMGAVFGLLLGTGDPKEKSKTYERTAVLAECFRDRYGSIVCGELLQDIPSHCIDYVRGAAQILEAYLVEEGIL